MESDDVALSDVHIDLSHSRPVDKDYATQYSAFVTRFSFRVDTSCSENCSSSAQYDEDGDLIVTRKYERPVEVFYIEHTLSTHLQDVGLQVWLGCLYLCDYIIHNHDTFAGQIVVEFGAGVGLASIVAAMFAQKVIATDVGSDILKICHNNVEANNIEANRVLVRELDWTGMTLRSEGEDFCWINDDIDQLFSADVLIMADVIYSDDLTDALFSTIQRLLTKKKSQKTIIISVEQRLNFTIDDLDVSCPAYKHFKTCLQQFCQTNSMNCQLIQNLPQYSDYERSKYLEIWEMKKR